MNRQKVLKKSYIFALILIFILGFFLRTKVFLINQSFWHDECALAWNILNKSYIELLSPLRFLQVAPFGFLFLTKFLTNSFGYSENIFRLIPYLASLFSIIAFYYLSKELFKTKRAVFFSNLIFAISFPLYYYASEFKPYSMDVLFCILALLIFQKINSKNLILNAVILSTFVWFSFPVAFVLASGIAVLLLDKKFNLKQKFHFILPFLINTVVLFSLYHQQRFSVVTGKMINYWADKFLIPTNFIPLFAEWIDFLFYPSIIIPLLIVVGVFIFIKEKSTFIKISLIAIFILILCSIFQFHPFYGRLILFLSPICIIYYAKAIDRKDLIVFILFVLSLIPQGVKTIEVIKKKDFYKSNSNPREMILFIKTNAIKNDLIFINTASNADFLYYKQVYGIENKYITDNLAEIKKGDNVWFFIPNIENDFLIKDVKANYIFKYSNITEKSLLILGRKK